MAGTFTLRVVSPEGNVLKEEVEFVVLPGEAGEIGILPHHAPLITAMNVGVIRYTVNGSTKRISTSGGFVEVVENKVTILADSAEPGEKIDLQRALAAKERAEKRLSQNRDDIDVKRAEYAFRKASARIRAAQDK
jgi:F-type H+-transporting ATPase subunit epsilon